MKNLFKIFYQFCAENRIGIMCISLTLFLFGCEKFVTVDKVEDSLFAGQVFDNEATANSAVAGIYKLMRDNFGGTVPLSLSTGTSSDELRGYSSQSNFELNNVLSTDNLPWGSMYKVIYQCNAAIEGLEKSSTIVQGQKMELLAEAKFLRAFHYFYLVNLFGDVPLITGTDVSISAVAPRSSTTLVYQQIKQDLLYAKDNLKDVSSYGKGEKIRANKWTAMALLSRVYLYQKDWANAFQVSNDIISFGKFSLSATADVFKKNSGESILQLANNPSENIVEASLFLVVTSPSNIVTNSLSSAFEANDNRKSIWLKNVTITGTTYYYPNKYTSSAVNPPEYYMLLRLAEQYLIRAEANAMLNRSQDAMDDVNLIRLKHGLLTTPVDNPGIQSMVLDMIMHERQVELFAEIGQRWFDLKRTGRVDAVIGALKPGKWQVTDALWPIPLSDLQRDPFLKQNPGYE